VARSLYKKAKSGRERHDFLVYARLSIHIHTHTNCGRCLGNQSTDVESLRRMIESCFGIEPMALNAEQMILDWTASLFVAQQRLTVLNDDIRVTYIDELMNSLTSHR
jgi:hypothetical protein